MNFQYPGSTSPSVERLPIAPSQGGRRGISLREVGAFKLTVGALLFITISRAHDYIPAVSAARPGLILFVLAIVLLVMYPGSARFKNLTGEWPSWVVLGLVAVACLGALTGLSLTASGAFLIETVSRLVTFFVLVAISLRVVQDLRFMMAAYVVSLIVLALIIIFLVGPAQVDGYTRIGETSMYDGNDLGVVFTVGLPFALLMTQAGGRWARLLGWIALVVVPLCIVMTASRGGFLALAACGLGMLFLIPNVSFLRRAGVLAAAVVTVAVTAPDGYWDQMATILNPEEDYNVTSDTGRLAIWTRGMGYVAEYPVFGVGPDNFVRAGWEISPVGRAGLPGVGMRSQAPHNTFLQVWAEMGTVGLMLWLSIIFGGIVGCLRTRSRLPRRWLRGTSDQKFLYLTASYLPISFIGFSVASFFTSHAYTGMFYILAAFLSAFHFLHRTEWRKRTVVQENRAKAPRREGKIPSRSPSPPRTVGHPPDGTRSRDFTLPLPSARNHAP